MNKTVKINSKLVLFILQTFFCIYSFAQSHSRYTLYIEGVTFISTSIVQISCSKFEEVFGNNVKYKVVTNEDSACIVASSQSRVPERESYEVTLGLSLPATGAFCPWQASLVAA